MVKGTSKQIVVVKSPDPKVFEEAIFIVKEDFFRRGGRANALKEAQKAANEYIRDALAAGSRHFRIPPFIWAIGGAILCAAVLLMIYYL